MSFKPSPQQQAFYDWVVDGRGSAVMEAVAGAGKTTTIVNGLKLMGEGQIALLAYNSKMGNELKERTKELRNVTAGTFHSAGMRLLGGFLKNKFRLELDEKKCSKIAERIIEQAILSGRAPETYREITGTLAGVVSMAKQRGFGTYLQSAQDDQAWADMIDWFSLDENLPEGLNPAVLVPLAKRILEASNLELDTIDFDDMIYLVIQRNLNLRYQSDWVLVDEAQDTNPVRRALAKKLLRPGGRLVAVGDPRQAIFGFTGADNDSLDIIAREFECVRLPLTVTYRCPKAVVAHAQQWVNHILAADTAIEGEVLTVPFESKDEDDFYDLVRAGDAVLCRYNKYLVNTCFRLIRSGKPARIEGRSIGAGLVALASKWKVKTLDTLQPKVESWMAKEVAKAMAEEKEQKADQIADRSETLLVLIERARDEGYTTVAQLRSMIEGLFDDKVVSQKDMITLCSAHRSKGLEWDRVFILGRSELMPSARVRHDWQMRQEENLIYVAVTRAQKTLIEVVGVKEEKKQHG